MNCNVDVDLLQDYLDGSMNCAEKMILEEHINLCAKCKQELITMKLLFFELQDMKKTDVIIPGELASIRKQTLDLLFSKAGNSMGVTNVLAMQKRNLVQAARFLRFLPGASISEKCMKQGAKMLRNHVWKLSGSIVKGGVKLVQVRFLG